MILNLHIITHNTLLHPMTEMLLTNVSCCHSVGLAYKSRYMVHSDQELDCSSQCESRQNKIHLKCWQHEFQMCNRSLRHPHKTSWFSKVQVIEDRAENMHTVRTPRNVRQEMITVHLRLLMGTVLPDEVLKPLWISHLPSSTQAIFVRQKTLT